MLVNITHQATLAQIDFLGLFAMLIAIIGTLISFFSLKQAIKKAQSEHEETFAKKELMIEKFVAMNLQVMAVNKEVDELKKDNRREHDELKKEFIERLNMIWDWIQKKA